MKRIFLSVLSIAILSLFLIQCSDNKKDTSADKKADYLFINGKVYTVNEKQPWAEAVAVKGKEIVFVGNTDKALSYKQIDKLFNLTKDENFIFAFHAEDLNIIESSINKLTNGEKNTIKGALLSRPIGF